MRRRVVGMCPTCGKERRLAGRECTTCIKRRWRENPENAERDRAVSRAWKERNREANRARDRARARAQRDECQCGGIKKPTSARCRDCHARDAAHRAEQIVELYERGDSLKSIAAAIGTSVNVIGTELDRLRKEGRIGRRRAYTRRAA